MTTEGRPDLQVDWETTFRKQRRDRLDDALAEFLNDDTHLDPQQCYESILASAQEWIDYHHKHMNRWVQFKSLMMGNRDVFSQDTLTTGNKDLDIS